MSVRKRLYLLAPALVVVLLHNAVHESLHYLAATLLGEEVPEFRFLTNGWGSSQVIYATPVAERVGVRWLVIAWLPAMTTTLVGYLVFVNRRRLLTRQPFLNALAWYVGAFFLLIDPLYFALLSLAVPGGDVEAAAAVGWSVWPVRLFAVAVSLVNLWLVARWQREARASPTRYVPRSWA